MSDKLLPGFPRQADFFLSQGPPVGATGRYAYDSTRPADTQHLQASERSVEHVILKMLHLSLNNPRALVALAKIELCVSALTNARSRPALDALLDSWGQTIPGLDASELEGFKRKLGERDEPP